MLSLWLIRFIQTISLFTKYVAKEGHNFTPIRSDGRKIFTQPLLFFWDKLFLSDTNPLSFVPPCLQLTHMCTCMIYECAMHECILLCVYYVLSSSRLPPCGCLPFAFVFVPATHRGPSTPTYQTSIEIASSDGIISDPNSGDLRGRRLGLG